MSSFFSRKGNRSELKYFAAPAGPPITISFVAALTMAGMPTVARPTAAPAFRTARRDKWYAVITLSPCKVSVTEPEQASCHLCTIVINLAIAMRYKLYDLAFRNARQ